MSTTQAKTIQIYLPDGNARGLRVAEMTSRTVQAVQVPRSRLEAAGERAEVKRVGVYVLLGDGKSETAKPAAYIGEAENCYQRLSGHHRKRDFWNTAVVVTSRTRSFTKAHARYLEYGCLRQARRAGRCRLQNGQVPTEPHIPEPMRAELRDNFGTIRTLLSVLGVPILDPLAPDDRQRRLYCRGNGAEATGEYTEDGLVVFEGSIVVPDTAPSASDTIRRRRQRLREDGVLAEDEHGTLIFTEDHAFNSPSGAAGVVLGRSSNGWRAWSDADGRSLDDLERQ
jgi:hypothetical protein